MTLGTDSHWTTRRREIREGFPGEVAISQHLQEEGGRAGNNTQWRRSPQHPAVSMATACETMISQLPQIISSTACTGYGGARTEPTSGSEGGQKLAGERTGNPAWESQLSRARGWGRHQSDDTRVITVLLRAPRAGAGTETRAMCSAYAAKCAQCCLETLL